MRLGILLLALLIDRLIGDPDWLWRRLAHPVVWFGALIAWADRTFNKVEWHGQTRKRAGLLSLAGMIVLVGLSGCVLSALFGRMGFTGFVLEAIIVSIFLAQKSLLDHVQAVVIALRGDGIAGGRRAVSMIVGRNPDELDKSGVCRAAIESLAENFSDGIVAPAFWYALFGLPGLLVYKLVNTADSMIGHKNATYIDFGWAAARLDDVMNFPPARISAFMIAAAAAWRGGLQRGRIALGVAMRDAWLHRSPNAGWPESAMAGALDLSLGGPRIYAGEIVSAPVLNGSGRRAALPMDIENAVRLTSICFNLLALATAIFTLLFT